MSAVELENTEELGFELPAIQEVVKSAGIQIEKPAPGVVLLSFITPSKQYTFLLNDSAADYVGENIRSSKITLATLTDLPR